MRFLLLFLISCLILPELSAQYDLLQDPRSGKVIRDGNYPVAVPRNPDFRRMRFRGVWVITVLNLDFPVCRTPDEFRRNYIAVVENLRRAGATAVLFQVRACNDAFYASRLNPWSRYLTGTPGRGLGNFDPMPFMIQEAHRRGLEFHAWLNPYRVAQRIRTGKNEYLKTLPPGDFARKNPGTVLAVPTGERTFNLMLDPGHPATGDFFVMTVREILQKYPVDAIHIDDYFYPYESIGTIDYVSYRRYNPNRLPLDQWRRNNVDRLIQRITAEVRTASRQTGRRIRFGVSPFGIWANRKTTPLGSRTAGMESAVNLHANSLLWVRNNWVDYVAPQLYWTFGHSKAPYSVLASWWSNAVRGTRVKLYTGHIPARLGTTQEWSREDEIWNQLRYNTLFPAAEGCCIFSYKSLFTPENAVMRKGSDRIIRTWQSLRSLR